MDRLSFNSATTNNPSTPIHGYPIEPPSVDLDLEGVIEQLDDSQIDDLLSESITSADIKSDPILASIAKQQRSQTATPGSGFRARPAPVTMKSEGLGPRMTKSAALRMGLAWDDPKIARMENKPKEEIQRPSHKRAAQSLSIPSLATPTLAPRQNKTSQLRTGQINPSEVKKDFAAAAAANKAKGIEERLARRKSMALPSSFSTPSITPRANKSSALRAGTQTQSQAPSSFASPSPKTPTALASLSGANVDKKPGHIRRPSESVKSLGAPSITPRLNKAALLRAPPSSYSISAMASPTATSSPPSNTPRLSKTVPLRAPPSSSSTSAMASPSNISVKTSSTKSSTPASTTTPLRKMVPSPSLSSLASPANAPRQTKASLLRAGLGAKVVPRV